MKILFFLSIAVYAGLMILGNVHVHYLDTETSDVALKNALPYLMVLSIIIGTGFFFWFTSVFPKGYQKQNRMGRIMLPIVFCILCFVCNRGIMMLYNHYGGGQKIIRLNGPVIEKYAEKRRRGRSLYLVMVNNEDHKQYKLKLTKRAYNFLGNYPETFNKEFKVGALGIIYRRDL